MKKAFQQLPYDYKFRQVTPPDGASGAVAGHVSNGPGTGFDFAVTLGSTKTIPVPLEGGRSAEGYEGDPPFNYNQNSYVFRHGSDSQKLRLTRARMAGTMAIKLCKQLLGKPCPL